MKCLEKDRARRYESASGLARDVERYLADEPVEACPPGAGYRLRKFARKYARRCGWRALPPAPDRGPRSPAPGRPSAPRWPRAAAQSPQARG